MENLRSKSLVQMSSLRRKTAITEIQVSTDEKELRIGLKRRKKVNNSMRSLSLVVRSPVRMQERKTLSDKALSLPQSPRF